MTRLLTTIRYDMLLQWRNGFYYVTFFMAGFWALLLPQASALNIRWLLPAMMIGNLLIGTFFFLGGLTLLERDERTPLALRTTPLRFSEYLASKIGTLAIPALAETFVIAGIATHWQFNLLLLFTSLIFACSIYCLIGYLAVQRAKSLNSYILPAGGYAAVLWVPLLGNLAGWDWWLVALNPLGGSLLLASASFTQTTLELISLGMGSSLLWIVVLSCWMKVRVRG